ncbi:hypothetical protein [Cochlodiniinecator piscidefendens]|uniref:hypothetical protein n=1 Tax=Cochlodiniinecator piscidefendens TaxID=2715756 RepID=UPI0014073CA9|nr:hypothetical protein [Cochlodiniinecator piscidefendens]
MTRTSISTGRVDWSGENPGIYLKTDPNGDYTTLALFFRVALSPYGRGHAAIVLGAPDSDKGWPDVPNFIMTDNQRMMRWIIDGWVRKMPTFIGKAGLDAMTWLDCDSVSKTPGDLKTRYSETLRGSGVTLDMVWRDMGAPIPVEVTKENSATKEHEMYSVFLEAAEADIFVNGTALPGAVAERQFFGRTMSTAFLAFSETWVTPEGDA